MQPDIKVGQKWKTRGTYSERILEVVSIHDFGVVVSYEFDHKIVGAIVTPQYLRGFAEILPDKITFSKWIVMYRDEHEREHIGTFHEKKNAELFVRNFSKDWLAFGGPVEIIFSMDEQVPR